MGIALLSGCILVGIGYGVRLAGKPSPPVAVNTSLSASSAITPGLAVPQPLITPPSRPPLSPPTNALLPAVPGSSTLGTSSNPTDPTAGMPLLSSSETPDPLRADRIKRVRIVRANFKYPLWRVEESVTRGKAGQPETIHSRNIMIADHVMVRLNAETDVEKLEALVQSQGLTLRKTMKMPGCYLVSIDDQSTNAIPRLLAILGQDKALIRYVEPDYVVHSQDTLPDDPLFSSMWGLHNIWTPGSDISAPQIWDLSTGDTQVVMGDIDTGLDYNHPDLAANVWSNTAETVNGLDDDGNGYNDDVRGWNFANDNNDPMDGHGHGTHTAGTAGAIGNNGLGVVGVNWRCQIIPLKFLDSSGYGAVSDAADALHYAADLKRRGVNIRVTNNSWGGGGYSSAFRDAVRENMALGILFIAAAGNDYGNNNDAYPFYPASYTESNIIAVAATDSSDALASFSNYGATSVDLGAPGVSILSTYPGSRYTVMSGTSMATPHVSGVALWLWNLWPSARAEDIRDAILKGTDAIPALTGITVTGGRLNARKALDRLFRIIHTPLENTFNTGADYSVDANIGPSILVDSNSLLLFWNQDNSTNFIPVAFNNVSNSLYRAIIPRQPDGSTIQYWIQAGTTNGLTAHVPIGAPSSPYHFLILPQASLLVTGTPTLIATVTPDYGNHSYVSGKVIQAVAPANSAPTNGARWACTGWRGTGSVPSSGATNTVTFTLTRDSSLTWQWQQEFALTHTSAYGPLNNTVWWAEGSNATTLSAPASASIGNTASMFIGWMVDGIRQPDPSSPAVNPVTAILMNGPHQAQAAYIPEGQDSDGNGLNDWWEYFYFGEIHADPNADPDGDGYSNMNEMRDRTNPRDPGSFPTPPVILHSALNTQQPAPAPYPVSAIITDNCLVVSATMFWTRNGGSITANPMSAGSGNLYTASLPAPGSNGDSFVYWIVATDLQAATTNGPYTVIPTYPVILYSPPEFNPLLLPETSSNLALSVTNVGNGAWLGNLAILWGGLSNDVENGTGDWTHSGAGDQWNISTARSSSGAHAWYCGNPDTLFYGSSMHAKLESPPFYVTSGAQLTFRHWIQSEHDDQFWRYGWLPNKYWDGGIVEISTNYGASFEQITPVGGYPCLISGYYASPWPDMTPCFAGNGSEWSQATFDLSDFAGSAAIIRFHFGSDDNTEEEGWYLDDIVVSPFHSAESWLTQTTTNLSVAPNSTLSTAVVTVSSAGISTGDRQAALWITGNAPTHPITMIPIYLSVRSPATITWLAAAQTSTNGTGLVSLSNRVFDADGDMCQAFFEWSASPGSPWSNLWITAVQSGIGTATVTSLSAPQVDALLTKTDTGLITNDVVSTWDSQSAGNGIVFSSNTLVRTRAWDGIFLGGWATSQPFMVDNEAPPTPPHFISLVHQTNAWSKNQVMSLRWDLVHESRGVGVADYVYGATTNASILTASGSTTGRTASPPPLPDGTNFWGWVRARDKAGNLSIPALFGPCWIDATPPSATQAIITLALSPYGNYVIGDTSIPGTWTGFSDGPGSGISGYYYAPTNAGGTTSGIWTTNAETLIGNLLIDQTNTVYVWAKDRVGWIGPAARTSFLALSLNGDWDHDGIPNAQEEITGTDALLGSSVLKLGILGTDPSQPGSFTLQWLGVTNRHYSISYRDTLAPGTFWLNLPGGSNLTGIAGIMNFTDTTLTHPARFYRISVTVP